MSSDRPAASAWFANERDHGWTCAGPSPDAVAFHRSLGGYAPTPLVDLPALATELGVGRVLAKDESLRLGLPAFKALGASWAIHRALREHPADEPLTIVTATDGNHGRAVARFARLLGHGALIYIPNGVSATAVSAVESEGAEVRLIDGSYDEAVAAAARAADDPGCLLVQDTAWAGYHEIPGWIVEGYATLFIEADEQARAFGCDRIDLVVVPAGVGSLLQAALAHYRQGPQGPSVISVEPDVAACMGPSLAAGAPVTVETGQTVMAGLNCGTPSTLAWPYVAAGLDGAVSVGDAAAIQAARDLGSAGIASGPCGGAGLAALRAVAQSPQRSEHLGIGPTSTVLIIVTEGSAANPLPEPVSGQVG